MDASLGPVICAAVIGYIFKLEERLGAMGVSFAVGKLLISFIDDPTSCLILIHEAHLTGATVAPFVGGMFLYLLLRNIRCTIVVHGILIVSCAFDRFHFLFSETSQPGAKIIEKMNAANGIDFNIILKSLWLLCV